MHSFPRGYLFVNKINKIICDASLNIPETEIWIHTGTEYYRLFMSGSNPISPTCARRIHWKAKCQWSKLVFLFYSCRPIFEYCCPQEADGLLMFTVVIHAWECMGHTACLCLYLYQFVLAKSHCVAHCMLVVQTICACFRCQCILFFSAFPKPLKFSRMTCETVNILIRKKLFSCFVLTYDHL